MYVKRLPIPQHSKNIKACPILFDQVRRKLMSMHVSKDLRQKGGFFLAAACCFTAPFHFGACVGFTCLIRRA
jgi:hypothetical protein